MENTLKNNKIKTGKSASSVLMSLAPIIGLVLLIIAYVYTAGDNLNTFGLKIILNQTVITAVVATGAIFIFTIGAFDISLGAAVAVGALTGGLVYNATGSIWLMLLTCVGTGVAIELVNSVLASLLNLPVFVTTIAMLSVLNALVKVLLGNNANLKIGKTGEFRPYDTIGVKLIVLGCFMLLCVLVFRYTEIGRQSKFLGSNSVCAKQTGISNNRLTILAFCIAGIGVGLSSFLTVVRAPNLSTTTAGSVGMDVLIAIVFGGMPLSGGSRSKISAALIGSLSMVLLGQILNSLGYDSGVKQIVKAVLFLLVVLCASFSYRDKLLPR